MKTMQSNIARIAGQTIRPSAVATAFYGKLPLLVLAALLLFSSISLRAATRVWNGGGANNNWSTGANWTSGAPAVFDDLQFAGSTRLAPANDFSIAQNPNSITFNSGAGAFTLGGNAVILGSGGITNNSTNVQTVNFSNFNPGTGGVVISSNQTWSAAAGDLQISSNVTSLGVLNLTIDGSHNTTISGSINDFGGMGIAKNGTGTLTLSGNNSYTGGTQINAGIVNAQSTNALGSGNVTVANTSALTVQGGITLGNNMTLVGSGVSSSGVLVNVSGNNTLNGDLIIGSIATQGAVINAASGTLTLNGKLSSYDPFFGSTTLWLAGSGTGISTNTINLGPTGGINKIDTGTWVLSGNNTYTGQTHISGGILNIQNDNALGTVDGNTVVDAGTTLQIQNDISVAEDIKISGTGAAGQEGAIVSVSGVNQLTGVITLVQNATIASDSYVMGGGLEITNTILGSGKTLTLSGSGVGFISGQINTGAGQVVKEGTGAWILDNLNTYTGKTTINNGILGVQFDGALGSTTNGTTVNAGGQLVFADVDYGVKETLTISGTGSDTGAQNGYFGAISNTGTSSFAGHIILAGDAWISGGFGGSVLTLTGGIEKNGVTLTFTSGTMGGGKIIVSGSGITGALPNSDLVVDNTTLVLSATSNYNGPTTIQNSGTLQTIGNNVLPTNTAVTVVATPSTFDLNNYNQSIGSLAGAGSVTLGSGTLTTGNNNNDTTFSGVISGSGGLTKVGTGAFTLTGTSTYSGPTDVKFGWLNIGDGVSGNLNPASHITVESSSLGLAVQLATSGTLGNNITNHSQIWTLASGVNTLSGIIDGDGALKQKGTGLTILTGSNTYTGDTVVESGTLQIGNGSIGLISGSSYGVVFSGAVLVLDLANGSTFSNIVNNAGLVSATQSGLTTILGSIFGSGTLSQDGPGLTVLTGANTYTGPTNVNNGTLQVGNGFSGSIAAASLVTVTSPGILNIDLANGGVFKSNIVDNGVVDWIQSGVNSQDDCTISGTGMVLFTGPGTTNMIEANSYSGGSIINNGFVNVGASTALGSGTLTINNGILDTYLKAIVQINVGGLVQDGGQVNFHVKGTGPGTYTNIVATGAVNITGGSVYLYDATGTYVPYGAWTGNPGGDTQTLVTGASVTGTYPNGFPLAKIYNSAFDTTFNYQKGNTLLYAALKYTPTTVVANWIQDPFNSIKGLTPNQSAVGGALNYYQSHNGPSAGGLITFLDGQNVKRLPGLYDMIAPDELASIFQIGFSGADVQNANIERHLEQVRQGATGYTSTGFTASTKDGKSVVVDGKNVVDKNPVTPESKRWSFFLEGSGEFSSVGTTNNASGYNFTTAGVTLGADYRVNENFAIGIVGGYANTSASLVNSGNIDLNSGKGGVYATVFGNGFYADALVGAGYNSYDTTRGSVGGNATGSTNGWELDTLVNGGYDFHKGGWTFGPTASVAYTQVTLNNYTETGSLAALKYPNQSQESLRTNLGAKISYTTTLGGLKITPQVRVSWQHEYLDSTQSIGSQFAVGSSSVFTVSGPAVGRDSALVSAGVSVQITPTISAYTYYDGQLGRSNYSSNNVTGGVKIDF